ncbi:MAG: sialate O-acetylesterase [Verrucomicrobiae bacterium]|nr:sialate O-acetylesterase [Verrucomicrobiae bacterium]NNJ42883.1 hypothetical protein [Akkermansiaceae bacterium]
MKSILTYILLLLSMAASASSADQKLVVAVPFTDNMVLQRQTAVPIWGFDTPGNKVVIEFAGQTKTAVTDNHGDWMVKLDPLNVSHHEQELKITNNENESIVLQGVLVGEVWFSSGQSNMVWSAGKSMCNGIARKIAASKEDIPIREININTVSALYPQKKATSDGGWKKAKEASQFSALSLSFAYQLYKELNMPIGILLSAHSNTRVEAFTQRQAIEAHPKLMADADLIHNADPLSQQGVDAFKQYYNDLGTWQKDAGVIAQAGGKVPKRPSLPGIAGMWRGPSQFYNGKINPVIPFAVRGAIWCQGTSNSKDGKIYAARMEALVKGWRDAWAMPKMPFYFTQMQCYGTPHSDSVGFADIRQAQHLFFINNRENVGMVVQSDLNSARPSGIHYYNKLHPGMRMARWALAKDYGKDIAYTGPIYAGYQIKGGKAIVSFEKGSLFGGLMVANKGMAKDYKEPGKFVEPAKATPDAKLNHFRLCGKDKKWHTADAVIVGDTVVVSSQSVPAPMGVQYAYNSVPENSNLYNQAGLPATPFAAINGKLIFEEDNLAQLAAQKAKYARYTDPNYPILQVAQYYRDGAILQRDKPIPVWGHANQGVKVTITLGGVTKTAVANDYQQWAVEFPAMKASTQPITLTVESSHDRRRIVKNILVGDVWYLTGTSQLTSEWAYNQRDQDAKLPASQPLVREFRKKTKASTSPTPRKRSFETGGGKYRSSWMAAEYTKDGKGVTMFAYEFAKALNRQGIPQGFITMSSGRGGHHPQIASPLSWTSFDGVKAMKHPAFQARLNELRLLFPHTEVAKAATAQHLREVQEFVQTIINAGKRGSDMSMGLPLQGPTFPVAGKGETITANMIPTFTYNWCVSPLTPMAVSGVIWIPADYNLGHTPENYAAELEIYAKSLPNTYGQDKVQFIYAHPAATLVKDITPARLPNAKSVILDQWPKSLKDIAIKMAKLAE